MRAPGYVAILLSLCCHELALGQDSSVVTASTTEWGKLHRCRPGPWGELEYYFVPLEAPGHIVDLIPAPSERPIWHSREERSKRSLFNVVTK